MTQDRSYYKYGNYVLLRALESDEISETWRAARLESSSTTDTVTLLRFKRGSSPAFAAAFHATDPLTPSDAGSTIVEGQRYETIDGDPVIVWNYRGGRSLGRIVKAATGEEQNPPLPIPLDQALAIADKLAVSTEASSKVVKKGSRSLHGALLPRFVWITEDGDVLTLGHGLGRAVAEAIAGTPEEGYLAPELRDGADPSPDSEVYGVGAILYALLIGSPPPVSGEISFAAAEEFRDDPIPDEMRAVVTRALSADPGDRYDTPAALRKEILALTRSGDYSATTFNLAFYLHSLLREELDAEPAARSAEKGLDPELIPLYEPAQRPDHAPSAGKPSRAGKGDAAVPAMFAETDETPKINKRIPLIAAIVFVLLAGSAAAWYFVAGPPEDTPQQRVAESPSPTPPPEQQIERTPAMVAMADTGDEPVEVLPAEEGEEPDETSPEEPDEDSAGLSDEEREALIQAEVERRFQERIRSEQARIDRELRAEEERRKRAAAEEKKREQEASAPPAEEPAEPTSPPPSEEAAPSAEELDRKALETKETAAAPKESTPAKPAPVEQEPEPEPVSEGDLISFNDLDVRPSFARQARLDYPPLARRQKIEETILVSVLISETGEVLETRIIKGESGNLGFDEAARRAVERSTFSPPMKDGKRVKTWYVFPVAFKIN